MTGYVGRSYRWRRRQIRPVGSQPWVLDAPLPNIVANSYAVSRPFRCDAAP
jgi:hypothetical protein